MGDGNNFIKNQSMFVINVLVSKHFILVIEYHWDTYDFIAKISKL